MQAPGTTEQIDFFDMLSGEPALIGHILTLAFTEDKKQHTLISLIATYRTIGLGVLSKAFQAGLCAMETVFDGYLTSAPISNGAKFRVFSKGGFYLEEEPAFEDAAFYPEGPTQEPYGILICRDRNDGLKVKAMLTEKINAGSETDTRGVLVDGRSLDVPRLARLLSCEDCEYRMHSAEVIWSTGHGTEKLIRSGTRPLGPVPWCLREHRMNLFPKLRAAVPFCDEMGTRRPSMIFTPSIRYVNSNNGQHLPKVTGLVGLSDKPTHAISQHQVDEEMAHFPVSLLDWVGAGASATIMRLAGVRLLSDVTFPDRLPNIAARSQDVREWVSERVEQAERLRDQARKRFQLMLSGVERGGRPEKRASAVAAETATAEHAALDASLDSAGRLPADALTARMRREETEMGFTNADFRHDGDSSDDEDDSEEDDDEDYVPSNKKQRTSPSPAPAAVVAPAPAAAPAPSPESDDESEEEESEEESEEEAPPALPVVATNSPAANAKALAEYYDFFSMYNSSDDED